MLGDFTARARDHIAPNRDMLHVDHREAQGRCKEPVRMPGVEPGSQAWEACMMPLHYMRCWECSLQTQSIKQR